MKATIKFTCPLYVVIDTESDEIEQVVVDDEHVDETPLGFYDENGDSLSGEEAAEALESYRINAERGLEWPGWEFGW